MLGVRQKNFLKFPLKFVLLNRLYALINSLMRRLLNCVFSVACLAVLIKMQFCVWKQSFPFFWRTHRRFEAAVPCLGNGQSKTMNISLSMYAWHLQRTLRLRQNLICEKRAHSTRPASTKTGVVPDWRKSVRSARAGHGLIPIKGRSPIHTHLFTLEQADISPYAQITIDPAIKARQCSVCSLTLLYWTPSRMPESLFVLDENAQEDSFDRELHLLLMVEHHQCKLKH